MQVGLYMHDYKSLRLLVTISGTLVIRHTHETDIETPSDPPYDKLSYKL